MQDYIKGKLRDKLVELIDEAGTNLEYCGAGCIADHLIANNTIVLPCKPGDTVWKVRKFCQRSTGIHECFKPSVEFTESCPNYVEGYYHIEDYCDACGDPDDAMQCSFDLKLHCSACKERFAVQPVFFDFSMLTRVFGTALFDEAVDLKDTVFLTKEAAQKAMENYLKEES